jgi:hypothetical protein
MRCSLPDDRASTADGRLLACPGSPDFDYVIDSREGGRLIRASAPGASLAFSGIRDSSWRGQAAPPESNASGRSGGSAAGDPRVLGARGPFDAEVPGSQV